MITLSETPIVPSTPQLPPGWELVRVKDVGDVQLGRQRAPQHHTGPQMRPYLRAANVTWGRIDVTSLQGVNALLATRGGTLAAWAHMLALDLFTGAWIYRQCRLLDAPAWVRIPSLFGTLMAGPAGLLFFLAWRAWRTGDQALMRRPAE